MESKYILEKLPDSIMRRYDIRGIVGKDITENIAYSLGRYFGTFLLNQGASSIAVGYDGRLSSPDLKEGLVEGLLTQGVDVFDVGLCPTPLLSYAHFDLNTDAGIMITGSHNPPDHNGFKITFRRDPFFDQQIKELNTLSPNAMSVSTRGRVIKKDLKTSYAQRVTQDTASLKTYKIIWDCGHGAAGSVLPEVLKLLPGEHTVLYERVDGSFPAHHPDPTVEKNLIDLQEAVIKKGADVGFAFDGDADRLGVVDNKGNILWADTVLILLATDVLKRLPGEKIIADIKSSGRFFEEVQKAGGVPVMAPTGHSIIKTYLKELSSPLAGEMSGHIFFKEDYYGFDDAIYAAVRTLKAMCCLGGPLSNWVDSLPPAYVTPEIRIPYLGDKNKLLDNVHQALKKGRENSLNISTIDGLRVSVGEEGWWLLKASNTQEVLVVRCEGDSEESLQKMKNHCNKFLNSYGIEF